MKGWVRRRVYQLGFRPKKDTIFYSPSLTMLYACREGFKEARKNGRPAIILPNASRPLHILNAWDMLFAIKFCPICGYDMSMITAVDGEKYCPNNHGKLYVSEDREGLPIIAFELRE